MRAWPILFLIPLLGCASVPEDEEILPCPEVTPAEHGPWRLVGEDDFTYCVPTEWSRSGVRAWRWGSGELQWGRRGGAVSREVRRVGGRELGPPPLSPPRETRELIGQYMVEISIWENPGEYRSRARWSDPMDLFFLGGGQTPEAGEVVRLVYRTVRFR